DQCVLPLLAAVILTGAASGVADARQSATPSGAQSTRTGVVPRMTSTSRTVNDSSLADVDSVIEQAIAKDEIPGGVLLVGSHGRIVWRKAYGSRAVLPKREAMTPDTI